MLIGRRALLGGGLATLGLVGASSWVLFSPAAAPGRLVVVMLRGAIDGLSVVAPYHDPDYTRVRPTIALPAPKTQGGLIALNGIFGLHPALSALAPLWAARQLAFVQASGSSNPTRSHFDAQSFMEIGTDHAQDGWMNRLVSVLPGVLTPTTAISLGQQRPEILYGPAPSTAFPVTSQHAQALDQPQLSAAFEQLYTGQDPLDAVFAQGRQARRELMQDLTEESQEEHLADHGAPRPGSFPGMMANVANIIVRDPRVRLAFTDLGGWDTHVAQGSTHGPLAKNLQPLGEGLAVLAKRLGPEWNNTTVVVMSEFGRTVHENGGGGTDHGHGNTLWILGGRVQGGRVYGDWPGLGEKSLYQGRDLAVTTDFRAVLARVLGRHLHLNDTDIARVFPDRVSEPAWLYRV